jgi:Holliday junction DNA helicase RuvA
MPTGDAGFVVPAAPVPERGAAADAVSALLNLGWRRPEAASVVARVQDRLGEGADLNTLIRESLKEMAPR